MNRLVIAAIGALWAAMLALATPALAQDDLREFYARMPAEARITIQRALIFTGDFKSNANSYIGDGSLAAIRSYQRKIGSSADGRLEAAEIRKLVEHAARIEAQLGYRLYDDPATGATMGVPAHLVSNNELSASGVRLYNADRSIAITTHRLKAGEATLQQRFEIIGGGKDNPIKKREKWFVEFRDNYEVEPGKLGDFFIMFFRVPKVSGKPESGQARFYMRTHTCGAELRGYSIKYNIEREDEVMPAIIAMASDFKPCGRSDTAAAFLTLPPSAAPLAPADRTRDWSASARVFMQKIASEQQIAAAKLEAERRAREEAERRRIALLQQEEEERKKQLLGTGGPLIPAPQQTRPQVSASGFFVSREGHVLTSLHATRDCKRIVFGAYGEMAVAAQDANFGIALLKPVSPIGPQRFLSVAASPPSLQEAAIALGYPTTQQSSSVEGAVTALSGLRGDTRFLQVAARMEPGYAGSPVFDLEGRVIGIVSARETFAFIEQLGTTIPIDAQLALRSESIELFLRRNNVLFAIVPSVGNRLNGRDVVQTASGGVESVVCLR